jgi:hypothetical protein
LNPRGDLYCDAAFGNSVMDLQAVNSAATCSQSDGPDRP